MGVVATSRPNLKINKILNNYELNLILAFFVLTNL